MGLDNTDNRRDGGERVEGANRRSGVGVVNDDKCEGFIAGDVTRGEPGKL